MVEAEEHELVAAYALDALDEDEERQYEEHLRRCARCREELASLREAATSLAYGVPAPPPPPALRERILAEARGGRTNVVPLRPRVAPRLLAGIAAAAATVAVGLGAWAGLLAGSLADEREALNRQEQVIDILADEESQRVALSGADGLLAVSPEGRAALVVQGLGPAPEGKTYEAWVIDDGRVAAAGLFDASDEREIVTLTRRVPRGASVAVTVERAGGVAQPTQRPIITARA